MSNDLFIIDGSNMIYRAFFALPAMQAKDGRHTNAAYGFTTMLMKLLADYKPKYIVVAFDKGKHTFRHQMYSEYKAKRNATPSELREQFSLVYEILNGFGIKVLEDEEYEADDIIGTLAKQAVEQGYNTCIVSGDKDVFQLIDTDCKVLFPKKGMTDMLCIDKNTLLETYHLTPEQIIDYKALTGDTSDNIPGIAGIGDKTALKLLNQFGNLDNLLQNIQQVAGSKMQQKIYDGKEQALMSRQLATIVRHIPVEYPLAEFAPQENIKVLTSTLSTLNFTSIIKKLEPLFVQLYGSEFSAAEIINKQETAINLPDAEKCKAMESSDSCFSDVVSTFIKAAVQNKTCLLFQTSTHLAAHTQTHQPLQFRSTDESAIKALAAIMEDPLITKVTFNIKDLYKLFLQHNVNIKGKIDDILLFAYLDNNSAGHILSDICSFYLEYPYPVPAKEASFTTADLPNIIANLQKLHTILVSNIRKKELLNLYNETELPLSQILAAMENSGIAIDHQTLTSVDETISQELLQLQNDIQALAEEPFNINSPKQLGEILFGKLQLPKGKKTKTGFSTNAEVLESLAGFHPIIDNILRYRLLNKLKSTYLDSLSSLWKSSKDGRIHTTFNQAITATGRLSSSDPNLQNIPIRTTEGKRIRQLFVPGNGYDFLMSADYSQIELRILAHLANDQDMLDAFKRHDDIHTITASEIFRVPISEVSPSLRSKAKAVNFGIIYGISDYGLSRDTGVSRKEAASYISNYFTRYPAIKIYLESCITFAKQNGYIKTILGRTRYLPDINSSNFNTRAFAERIAMNTPIQGSAADIIKKAMIALQNELLAEKYSSRLLLQVHDELVLEVTHHELSDIQKLVKKTMENAVSLSLPLEVDIKWGKNWDQK